MIILIHLPLEILKYLAGFSHIVQISGVAAPRSAGRQDHSFHYVFVFVLLFLQSTELSKACEDIKNDLF